MTGMHVLVVPAAGPGEGLSSTIWLSLDCKQGLSISYQGIHRTGLDTCMSLGQLEAHTKGTRQSITTAGEATRSDGVSLCTGDDRDTYSAGCTSHPSYSRDPVCAGLH